MQILTHMETLIRKFMLSNTYRYMCVALAIFSLFGFIYHSFGTDILLIEFRFVTLAFWTNEAVEAYRYRAFLQKYQ